MNCKFKRADGGCVCEVCGRKLRHENCERGVARCGGTWQIGDELEKALTTLGITKERYRAAKEAMGLPPTCNCAKRQKWLNQMGERLQVSAGKLKEIYDGYYAKPR